MTPTIPWQQRAIDLVLNSVNSENSRRAYGAALRGFFLWLEATGRTEFTRETVAAYRASLVDRMKPQSVNLHMAAIKALANQAAAAGLMDHAAAMAITSIKGEKRLGQRTGRWLTLPQARALLQAPDTATLGGLRDRAVLGLLIGAGLRREEVAGLVITQVQQREDRWVIADLMGKGRRFRTVAIPDWVADRVWAWVGMAKIGQGPLIRQVYPDGVHPDRGLTASAVYRIAVKWAEEAGLRISPHDLRRTFAALAKKGGAEMQSIQAALGHSSVQTTERYLGTVSGLEKPACDKLGIRTGEV